MKFVLCLIPLIFCRVPVLLGGEGVLIEGCAVFDPRSGKFQSDRAVLTRGDKIESVLPMAEMGEIPSAVTRVDGRGKYLLPGLIDAHVHVVHILDFAHMTGDEVLPLCLAAGVTSIRSTGDEIVAATIVARTAASRPNSSPRVFTCSPLLDADPPIHRDIGRAVTAPDQVAPILDDLLPWNIHTVKIYARTEREIGQRIIEEGHRRGLFITAHLGAYPAEQAVGDGVDCLEHIISVYNYLGANDLQVLSEENPDPLSIPLIRLLVERKTMVDPTLAVFRNMIHLSDAPEIAGHADNALAPQRLRDFWPIYLKRAGCPQGGTLEERRTLFARYQRLTGLLQKAGVPLLCGTDSPEPQVTPGYSLHQELEMLVESGLTPAEALRSATLTNALALREEKTIGSIEAGKYADMVLLKANPLEDIRNTREIEFVVRSGELLSPADLSGLVPVK